MTDHLLVALFLRQVTDPAAHQIKHNGTTGNALAIKLRQPLTKSGIEMLNKTGIAVKKSVIAVIELEALVVVQDLHDHGKFLPSNQLGS